MIGPDNAKRAFERALANHCAPVLLGKKPAALLNQNYVSQGQAGILLGAYGLRTVRLHWQGQRGLLFIYHPGRLNACLQEDITQRMLWQMGYPTHKEANLLLGFMHRRFRESPVFPHEVGFFLGYPPKDVIAFIKGQSGYKLNGPWKVYTDVEHARAVFSEYARCRRALLKHLDGGGSIFTTDLSALAG